MTECTQESFDFPACKRRRVEARFDGGDITSDGGVLLLQQADRRLGLSPAVAKVLDDPRRRASCTHDLASLIRQRLYGLALGYEDLNDHQALRQDLALQTAVERDTVLASASTLCRWENRADRAAAGRLHEVLVEQFIASFRRAPKRLILDVDATDDAVHGQQEHRFFHGYYDHYASCRCMSSAASNCWSAICARAQSTAPSMPGLSWRCWSGAIVKAEHTTQGSKPRYLVTNLKAEAQYLYDRLYCARGEMENRIKEQQLDLFADRTSCHAWWPNQFRLLLSSLAYTLLEAIRRLALDRTELANAYVGTIRLKLLKIGAVITRNTRRIRFLLSSTYPYQRLFAHVVARLRPT